MSAALKLIPISDQAEKLSQKPPLGQKRCKPVLAWKNPKLSPGMHREKPKAKLMCVSGGNIYYNSDVDPYEPLTDSAISVATNKLGPLGFGNNWRRS